MGLSVDAIRKTTCSLFKSPPKSALAALSSIQVPQAPDRPAWHPVVPVIAWNRKWFSTACLRIDSDEGITYWKFMYALQSPYMVCLVRLKPSTVRTSLLQCACWDDVVAQSWDFVFDVELGEFMYSDDGWWKPVWDVWILTNAAYGAECSVVTDGAWIRWTEVSSMLNAPRPTPAPGPAPNLAPSTFEDDIYSRNPWVASFLRWHSDDSEALATSTKRRRLSTEQADADTTTSGPKQEVVDACAVMDALLSKRAELLAEAPPRHEYFRIWLRGGPDLKARTGKDYDGLRGLACSTTVEQWCRAVGLRISFTVSLDLYGEDVCTVLCNAWVARMQCFRDVCFDEMSSQARHSLRGP